MFWDTSSEPVTMKASVWSSSATCVHRRGVPQQQFRVSEFWNTHRNNRSVFSNLEHRQTVKLVVKFNVGSSLHGKFAQQFKQTGCCFVSDRGRDNLWGGGGNLWGGRGNDFIPSMCLIVHKWKWNESGFRPLLCIYRLNWTRRTSWGWWDEWDDTALQTQDSKFKPLRSEAEHATCRSRRLPTILNHCEWTKKKHVCFFQTAEIGKRTPNASVKGSGANHYPGPSALVHKYLNKEVKLSYLSIG